MCNHLDKLDLSPEYFVWCEQGVYSVVSPEEQAALRRDDKALFIKAALAYPWMQLKATAYNIGWQLAAFAAITWLSRCCVWIRLARVNPSFR